MKKTLVFVGVLFLLSFVVNTAQSQSTVKNTPGKYTMPMDNASASLPGKTKEGELWVVFSDRPNNPLYSDKACNSANGRKLDFMTPMYVIDETESSVRVISVNDADVRGNLKDGAASKASWIKKDNMLLWRTCLKTRDVNLPEFKGGIFNKKAMVLNILGADNQIRRIPEFYSHPRCSPSDSINSALVYQINYVYKETATAYLLGDIPEISDFNNDPQLIRGWVLKSQTTAWNHRLAYEVNWDDKAVAERKSSQKNAKIYSAKTLTGATVYEEPAALKGRAIGEIDRFPVLDVTNGLSKVGVIGELRSENGKSLSSTEFANIKHVIDSMSASMRNVNIIFVIDATSSMVPFSQAIQNALKTTTKTLFKGQNNYKFGALLYRDASEGNANAINFTRDLSSNYNGINSLLTRYLTPTYNKCNNDPEEAVYYGIKKAIERFDPPAGESNFVILIGDCGNHKRTTYTDCARKSVPEFTNVAHQDLVNLMVRKNINLFAIQAHHQIVADTKPAYDAFRSQVEDLLRDVAVKRSPDGTSATTAIISRGKDIREVSPNLGIPGYLKKAPDGGSLHPNVLGNEITTQMNMIERKVNEQLDNVSLYLNGKISGSDARQIQVFIDKLKDHNIPQDKLNIVFQKNGQVYSTGYTKRFETGVRNPIYQDVLLMSQDDLYSIKKSLERLIPTDEQALSSNESRSYIVYGWQEILVDILGYFPEVNEAVDSLSLYTLSAILTGWGGKEKYRSIKLSDVTSPDRFPDKMLYEYLIDWCITKGHIQSIFDGQNLLTGDFYDDHRWTIFNEYLFQLSGGKVEEDPSFKQKFADYFKGYKNEYNNYKATFRIPMGTGCGVKHYWIDSRIFPHNSKEFGDTDFIETLYKDYIK